MEVGIRVGVCNDSPAEASGSENGWRCSIGPIPRLRGVARLARSFRPRRVGRSRRRAWKGLGVSPPGADVGADLGGSSGYSSGNLEE